MNPIKSNAFPIPERTPDAVPIAFFPPSRSFSFFLLLNLASAAFLFFLCSTSFWYCPLRAASIEPDNLLMLLSWVLIFSKPILGPSVLNFGSSTTKGADFTIAETPPPLIALTKAPPLLVVDSSEFTFLLFFLSFLPFIKFFALSLATLFALSVSAFLAPAFTPALNKPLAAGRRSGNAILSYQTID